MRQPGLALVDISERVLPLAIAIGNPLQLPNRITAKPPIRIGR